ncbi:hypothetical protein ADUPG1_006303, partial [Aduncisulcus paluster]
IANVYMAVVLVQMIWLGVRRADRSPAGWGLGLLATASAAVLVQVVHGGICNHIGLVVAPQSVWLTAVPSAIGGVCLLAGLLMPPLMLYWQARRKLSDLVDEWCSQIEDGLTLTAQLRDTPLEGTKPPTALAFRADAVARWLIGDPNPALNCCWLNTPEETSGQDWVLAIAARGNLAGLFGRDLAFGVPALAFALLFGFRFVDDAAVSEDRMDLVAVAVVAGGATLVGA